MSDYAPNNTGRYRIRYVANRNTHNITFRYSGDGNAPDLFLSGVEDFLAAIAPYMPPDLAVVGAFQAVKGVDIFFPLVNAPVWVSSNNPSGVDMSDSAAFGTFSGLSYAGAKARIQIMGMFVSPDDSDAVGDYRIQLTEDVSLVSALVALRAIPELVALDGQPILWYSYMNLGFHAHYQRKARRG